MNILNSLGKGAAVALRSWKGIIAVWLVTLVLISLLSVPLRSGVRSIMGASMVTELLRDTINADVITDMKHSFLALSSVLTAGGMLLIVITFIVNSFLSGGLFSILGSSGKERSLTRFFSGAASNFWSVLVITTMMYLIISVVAAVTGGIPLLIAKGGGSGNSDPASMVSAIRISLVIIAFILPVLLLVTDYARAWQVVNDEKKPFSAIGYGFGMTFRTFLSSYFIILITVLVQSCFVWFIVPEVLEAKPSTGAALFLFLIISQAIFITRIYLRTWRYAAVTAAMEAFNNKDADTVSRPDIISQPTAGVAPDQDLVTTDQV